MDVRPRRGLVVGKFCPLHRGHMLLIDTARAACDELLVISYTKPEFVGCAVEERAHWLATLYPGVRALVIDGATLAGMCVRRGIADHPPIPHNDADSELHRTFVGWLCLRLLATTVDAVYTSEDYGDGFAASLSAIFAAARARPFPVRHVCVDMAREAVPVSGTSVRADPLGARAFLADPVYASLVRRVCILGGESSGKTTLARMLAERLETTWAAEYGRELWVEKNGRLVFDDMLAIARAQVARERTLALDARGWLVCDTSPLTTLFYSREMFGRVDPELDALAARPYDVVLLCAPDIPFEQDGTRREASFRHRQHAWFLDELARRDSAVTVIEGDIGNRRDAALVAIARRQW
jgi:HTH-type transcriptional repressor of NAD biosynthesis genes